MICSVDSIADQYRTIRPLSAGAAYLMRRTVTLFSEWLGRAATVEDFDDLTVSRWLESLETSHAAWTRVGHRVRLMGLWRFAARRGLCGPPGEVRRAPAPEPMPEAWTLEQVARLLAACESLGEEESRYMRALIAAAYESGLRRGDLWRLDREQIRPDGIISLRQHKTNQPHIVAIRPQTAAEVLSLPGQRPLRRPWGTRRYTAVWAKLRSEAGIPTGACQQLRRTGATWIAARHGEDAARSWLGHRSADMIRHYVDRRVSQPTPWLPPTILDS